MLIHYGALEVDQLLKFIFNYIQDGGRPPNLSYLYYYNSDADCSISLKFGAEFDHVIADTLQTFKVKGSKGKSQGYSVT